MKVLELGLVRFGPFTDQVLDFSADGVHVVFGSNAAGKSTSLRAIFALLYGVPQQTPDAHVHRYEDLRISGRLRSADGEELSVVRRKGAKNTLLAGSDASSVLPESVLARILGGVSKEEFETTFGLDREALREGAEALLAGEGRVGQSLFDAATGGRGAHEVSRDLVSEADAIYAPRATTKPLNAALAAHDAARKIVAESALSADVWSRQQDAVHTARAERARLAERRAALVEEQGRLIRVQRALPLLAQRRESIGRRRALGDVVLLAPGAAERRLAAERALDAAVREKAHIDDDLASMQGELESLGPTDVVVSLSEEEVRALDLTRGKHVAAAADRPKLAAKHADLVEEARVNLAALGVAISYAEVDLQLQTHAERVGPLATRHSVLTNEAEHASRDREVARAALDALEAQGVDQAPLGETGTLEAALAATERLLDLEGRYAIAVDAAAATAAAKGRARARLDPPIGDATDPRALIVPTPEEVERFASDWDVLLREGREIARGERELAAARVQTEREIGAIERAGDVPTENALADQRKHRDGLFVEIARGLTARSMPSVDTIDGYQSAVRSADTAADRLRREGERVHRLAAAHAEKEAQVVREADLARERHAHLTRFSELEGAWRGRFSEIVPRRPAEMRGFVEGLGQLGKLCDATERAERERDLLCGRLDAAHAELRSALRFDGMDDLPNAPRASLGMLVERARREVAVRSDRVREARELTRVIEEQRQALARADSAVASVERARAAWEVAWRDAVVPIGLASNVTPEEAQAVVAKLGNLFATVSRARDLHNRIAGIDRDAERFALRVAHLADAYGPDLAGRAPEQAAAVIATRWRDASARAHRRRVLEEKVDALRTEHSRARAAAARERSDLDALARAAGTTDLGALVAAEQRSDEARALGTRIDEIEAEIARTGGKALTELERECDGIELHGAMARVDEIVTELDTARDEMERLSRDIERSEAGMTVLREGAASAAEDLEHAVTRVRALALAWARLRLGARLLGREMERYRKAHQGPVLGRASELFRRLTLGGFDTLTTGLDEQDEHVLRCVRQGGSEIGVIALSEGERDQLYLALRLATIEHHAQAVEPMPLVLDDVLMSFDETRIRVALDIFGELAARLQVLVFTHQARVVEIAREALDEKLTVHDLDAARESAVPIRGSGRKGRRSESKGRG